MKIVKVGCGSIGQLRIRQNEFLLLHFIEPYNGLTDKNRLPLEKGECLILDSSSLKTNSDRNGLYAEWVIFSDKSGETLAEYGLKTDSVYTLSNDGYISLLIGKIKKELSGQKLFCEDICVFSLKELLIGLSRETGADGSEKSVNLTTEEMLYFLRRKLSAEYNKDWTVKDMAELINISQSYLHIAYKTLFGVSPVRDLIFFRLTRAKELLEKTNMSVNEIASEVGYSNASHFIRQFTGNEGLSPYKYRKTALKGSANRNK